MSMLGMYIIGRHKMLLCLKNKLFLEKASQFYDFLKDLQEILRGVFIFGRER